MEIDIILNVYRFINFSYFTPNLLINLLLKALVNALESCIIFINKNVLMKLITKMDYPVNLFYFLCQCTFSCLTSAVEISD